MSYQLARQILSSVLVTYATSKSIALHRINRSFEPAVDQAYLAEDFLTSEPDERVLTGQDRIKGIYQISIIVPEAAGVYELETLQTEIINLYKSKNLYDNTIGYRVSIDRAYPIDMTEQNKKIINITFQAWRD